MIEILFMCFAVPLCLISGVFIPIVVYEWLERKLEK